MYYPSVTEIPQGDRVETRERELVRASEMSWALREVNRLAGAVDAELSRADHRRRTLPEQAAVEEAERTLRAAQDAVVGAQTALSDLDRDDAAAVGGGPAGVVDGGDALRVLAADLGGARDAQRAHVGEVLRRAGHGDDDDRVGRRRRDGADRGRNRRP